MHRLRNLLGPLRVFDAVNRTQGVARAAAQLHVTPAAVSQQLRQLEAALGVPLVRKAGREIALTDAGLRLALRLADLFDRIEAAVSDTMETGRPRRLRLKVIPTFAIKWLVPRLAGFYAVHNDIDVEIASVARKDDDHLENADFVVRLGVGQWSDVHFDHLFDDAFIPVCTPALAAKICAPRDLLQFKLLHSMMRPEAWPIWMKSAGLGAPSVTQNLTLANSALCIQAAADGLGVAIAQEAYVAEDLRGGRLIAPVNRVARTETGYYLVCDPRKAETYPLKEFRDWIRTVL